MYSNFKVRPKIFINIFWASIFIIASILIIYNLIFIYWLNTFWALPVYKDQVVVGIIEDQKLNVMVNRTALGVIISENPFKDKSISYTIDWKTYNKQICLNINPKFIKTKLSLLCKPLKNNKVGIADSWFTFAPVLSFYMVKSYNIKHIEYKAKDKVSILYLSRDKGLFIK